MNWVNLWVTACGLSGLVAAINGFAHALDEDESHTLVVVTSLAAWIAFWSIAVGLAS